jgi:hypothetical protein
MGLLRRAASITVDMGTTHPSWVMEKADPGHIMWAAEPAPVGIQPADRQGWRVETVDYEIRIKGRVSDAQLLAFEGMKVTVEPVETVVYGPFADQEAVHQLMVKLQSLGLEVVELRRLPGHAEDDTAPAGS